MYSVLIGQSVSHDYDQLKFSSIPQPAILKELKKKKFYFVYNMLANPETKQLNGVKMLHKLNIKYMPIFTNISPWHPNLIHIIPKLFAICLRHFMKVTQLCPTLCDPMDYSPWNSPGHNTGVGYLSLLQGIFLTQELSWGLLHCRWILYQLSQKGSPGILEWVAYPFSSRSSQPRNWTGVSCIAGRFFTNWTLRELSAI